MKVSDELAQVSVRTLDGNARRVGDLWQAQPAVVFWLRHYG
jgi:hypothetical protein